MDTPVRVVLIGGGGHARSVLEVIAENGFTPVGYVDEQRVERTPIPWLGARISVEELSARGNGISVICTAGDNVRRMRDSSALTVLGMELCAPLLSVGALVAESAEIGQGTVVMPGAVVRAGARVGKSCILNSGSVVDHDCVIGDFVHIGPGASVAGSVVIGDGAFLGVGSSVIPGIAIGEWSTLGAGGVAIRSLDPNSIYVGVPAQKMAEVAAPETRARTAS